MKRFFAIIIALVFVVSLVACNDDNTKDNTEEITDGSADSKSVESQSEDVKDTSEDYYFTAKIVEKNGSTLLLEVSDQGHSGLNSGTLATIAVKSSYPTCEVGDTVKVVFDGVIQETYPCQLPNVYSVTRN